MLLLKVYQVIIGVVRNSAGQHKMFSLNRFRGQRAPTYIYNVNYFSFTECLYNIHTVKITNGVVCQSPLPEIPGGD